MYGLASLESWVGVVASLAAVPLAFVMLYLRGLREHQLTKHRELAHRVERLEESTARWSAALGEVERDFATKEEWLRETMHARHRLEQLMEAVARLDASVYGCSAAGAARRPQPAMGGDGRRAEPDGSRSAERERSARDDEPAKREEGR